MKKVKVIIKEVSPVLVTLIAAYFTSIYPVNFSFIPLDKAYGISLTIYSVVFAGIFRLLFLCMDWWHNRKSFVKIEFAEGKPKFEELELINCDFTSDFANIYMRIKLEGSPKNFNNKQIKIILPPQIKVQRMERYATLCELDDTRGVIFIALNKLYNTEKTKRLDDSMIVGFKVIKNYEEVQSSAEVGIEENKKKRVILKTNEIYFRK